MRLLAIACTLVMFASTASADRKAAERLFRAGEKAYRAQKFLIAAQNFEQAYKELAVPELAFSAAQAYRRQYRVDSAHTEYAELAAKYYQLYLDEVKTGGRVGDAADSLGEMRNELIRLGIAGKARATPVEQKTRLGVSIVFADNQRGSSSLQLHEVDEDKESVPQVPAKAFIDGKRVEVDDLHDIAPGDHRVRAEADGYKPAEKQVHVFEGTVQNSELTLDPLPAQVTVKAEDGASIIVDGRGAGTVPHAALDLAGGSHVITLIRAGRRPVAREIVVTRAQKLVVPISLQPTLRRRAVPWVASVGGVAVLATGFFLLGAKHYDDLALRRLHLLDMGDQDASVLADYNRFKHRRDIGLDLSYAAGGAAIAIGITAAWMYYFDTPSSEGVRVEAYASGTGGGAAISGRF
jgi:hypothetical protein